MQSSGSRDFGIKLDGRVLAFIQGRMSSGRFPGKILAPFFGRPIIEHLIDRVAMAVGRDNVVVATSDAGSDDPVAWYLDGIGVKKFRGPLDDVFARFVLCLKANPCDWFFRVCADSPLLDPSLFGLAASRCRNEIDLVTNVFPRTFPKGQSVELLKAGTFAAIDQSALTDQQREHLTKVYYDNPEKYRIVNVKLSGAIKGPESCVVDTIEDLRQLEAHLAVTKPQDACIGQFGRSD
ncbi:MAG: spore coat protein [Planctomycetes bacterium]|nr:spore coat protein [Planctomycetota bacterium]